MGKKISPVVAVIVIIVVLVVVVAAYLLWSKRSTVGEAPAKAMSGGNEPNPNAHMPGGPMKAGGMKGRPGKAGMKGGPGKAGPKGGGTGEAMFDKVGTKGGP